MSKKQDRAISGRLREIRESTGISRRKFAQKLEVSPAAWQGYENGTSLPGAHVLQALAFHGYDVHWILTGEGRMKRPDLEEEEALYEEGSRQRRLFAQLRRLMLLASRGKQAGLWQILHVLMPDYPHPLSFEEIRERLRARRAGMSEQDIRADLEILLTQGHIKAYEENGEKKYTLTSDAVKIGAREVGDVSQSAEGAMAMLLGTIWPTIETDPRKGAVMGMQLRITNDNTESLMNQMINSVLDSCKSFGTQEGEGELALVFAVANPDALIYTSPSCRSIE